MIPGTYRNIELLLTNNGAENRTITLSCEGDLCSYITLENTTIELPTDTLSKQIIEVKVSIPSDIDVNSLSGNIKGTDSYGLSDLITVKVTTSGFMGIISSLINSLSNPFQLLILLGSWLFSSFLLYLLLQEKNWGLGVSTIS